MIHAETPLAVQLNTHLARQRAGAVHSHGVWIASALECPLDGPVSDTSAGYNRLFDRGQIVVVSAVLKRGEVVDVASAARRNSMSLGPHSEVNPLDALDAYFHPKSPLATHWPEAYLHVSGKHLLGVQHMLAEVLAEDSRHRQTAELLATCLDATFTAHNQDSAFFQPQTELIAAAGIPQDAIDQLV